MISIILRNGEVLEAFEDEDEAIEAAKYEADNLSWLKNVRVTREDNVFMVGMKETYEDEKYLAIYKVVTIKVKKK
uniref:Uncharacterized protein n=2 Tax=viral metagenome TaxID=1070528 RepID=A0A6M3LNF0_9ZZZZ